MRWPKLGANPWGVLALALGLLAIPQLYGAWGEGPRLIKVTLWQSAQAQALCGRMGGLYVVPWGMSLSDSDSQGELEMAHWVRCGAHWARVDSALAHRGGPWQVQRLTLTLAGQAHDVLER
ncbi:hypothetical protein [Aquabacterium sp.]|jgi:hypothetical protein|uniref:hypothetical protein n=1 Tax=Aquabacterium sp. TaxID=1872578 RepID=UPI002489FA5A|nr:hypothetical protein [Aquabacterium sp.]MDI1350871.1 hypothetical protein [Aquabacterium sp.]